MTTDQPTRTPNRLSKETSPYLLQHQHNPVDWYPWGEEAFARARAENKPLLISIGYSACHWCHVMEHESFSNEAIAKYINETVIPVKVDREERPDVDAIYMNACQAMTGQGGWPLNAFVTPDLKPFFVGTYFPPADNYGRPGFTTVLAKIREAWLTDGHGLKHQAEALYHQLAQFSTGGQPQPLSAGLLKDIVTDSASMYDARHGGFGTAPKFPPDTRLAALLASYSIHGTQSALDMTVGTLKAMAYGGLYDQVGGGFARYSVDARWLIPHFEKMLYNQALLLPVYADAWLITQDTLFERIATETADWVLRDLTSDSGVFQCAYDADSEGEEGKFYVWTPDQIAEILDTEDAQLFCKYYGITPTGNFEHGTSNPHIPVPPHEFATANGFTPEAWMDKLTVMRHKVRTVREKRPWPGLDDKCLTGWNGLMITALCRLAQVLDNDTYANAASQCAGELLAKQWDGTTLLRVYKNGNSTVRGTLEDYAFFCDGLIDLYETTFDIRWITAAKAIAEQMVALFTDESGGFYYTDGTDKSLISRTKDTHDGALPSSASVASKALLRLGRFYRDEQLTQVAAKAISSDGRRANSHPMAYASLLLAELYSRPEVPEITITASSLTKTKELAQSVYKTYAPVRILATRIGDTEPLPITSDKSPTATPQAYICKNFTCSAPITTPQELKTQLMS